jgi:hypothetical protein
MAHWSVRPDGLFVHLSHWQADEDGPIWSGTVEILRGAPGAGSHPELTHAFMAMDLPAPHQEFIRHKWTWEIPDYYRNLPNFGESRRYLILQASGGYLNWTLELCLPPLTPRFVWTAICRGFNSSRKEQEMTPKGPSQTGNTQTLGKGEVPPPKMPLPPAGKDGAGSVISPT